MEKWKAYRKQIENSKALNSILSKEKNIVNKYKHTIDNIDKSILNDVSVDVTIDNIISIDSTQSEERFNVLNSYAELIDDRRLSGFRDDIHKISSLTNKENIINNEMKFSEDWLNLYEENNVMMMCQQKLQNNNLSNFAIASDSTLESINSLEKEISNTHLLEKIESIRTINYDFKARTKMLAIIFPSIIAVMALIGIAIALVIDLSVSF